MIRIHPAATLGALFLAACGQPSEAVSNTSEPTASGTAPLAAPSSVSVQANHVDAPAGTSDHATINGALKHELVGTGSVDGHGITDVRMLALCRTAFVSGDGLVEIDWTKVGNFAGRVEGGVASLPIADDHGSHVFTLPDGPSFRRIDGSMGLLADDCDNRS